MSRLAKRDALEFQVSDFGPIVDATIELRPLTVFVGPSNTGKSYLAILIYALHRFFGGAWFARRRFGGVYGMVRPSGTLTEPQAIIDSIGEIGTIVLGQAEVASRRQHRASIVNRGRDSFGI